MTADLVPAAQYLRMSTEHQQYSMQNQTFAIQRYAEFNGFEIVCTYADPARTGVVLRRRAGLQRLLQDVIAGTVAFRAILVYDVSRWGRFQDSDEAAHYEFVCKTARIPVHYCSETFANDSALPNLIMKALKRTMAGEYSRELGVRVSAGLRRIAALGFKAGGVPGYGLRRVLVGQNRIPKHRLNAGESKGLHTDRVILAPGPAHEIKVVHEIYRMLIYDELSVKGIARVLNRRGIRYSTGTAWDNAAVYGILTNLKYIGCYAFGRTSARLYTPVIKLPRSEWIVVSGAFEAIVDYPTFAQAQQILYYRSLNKTENELLNGLRNLLRTKGRLTGALIAEAADLQSPTTYRIRFGSLQRAYERIGYGTSNTFDPIDLRRRTRALRNELITTLLDLFPQELSVVTKNGKWRSQLRVESGHLVSVLIVRSIGPFQSGRRWLLVPVPREIDDLTLIARLDAKNESFVDYYVLPGFDRYKRFHLTENDPWLQRGKLVKNDLSDFCHAVSQIVSKGLHSATRPLH